MVLSESCTTLLLPKKIVHCIKSSQLRFMILTGVSLLLIYCSLSILPAFYPLEAIDKGANTVEVGLIMGVCWLGFATATIPWSYVTTKMSCKLQLSLSLFGISATIIAFGFVDRLPNGAVFISASFIIRILSGLISAIFEVTTYSMIPVILAEKASTGISVMEMCVGVGYLLGPAIGGFLFDFGGFIMPFIGLGVPMILVATFCFCFIQNPVIPKCTEKVDVKKLILCPYALVYCAVLLSVEVAFGFLTVSMEETLIHFNISHGSIGSVLLGDGIAYSLTMPIWGFLCDKGYAEIGCLLGTIISCFAFLFLGPNPWLPFGQQFWLIILCVVLNGIASAPKLICGFTMIMDAALNICNLPSNALTYALVSSMFSFVVHIGGFISPFIGGWILAAVGMRWGTTIIFFWEIFLIILQLIFLLKRKLQSVKEVKIISANSAASSQE